MLIALALIGLAQSPPDPGHAHPAPDPVFVRVVEDWVIDARPEGTGLTLALGDRRARIVRTLGNDRYDARRLAAELLMAEPPQWRRRMLLWGARSRDAEIRGACRRLAGSGGDCPHCGEGAPGKCPLRWPRDSRRYCEICSWRSACGECRRAGRIAD